jgi:hypothetical protein
MKARPWFRRPGNHKESLFSSLFFEEADVYPPLKRNYDKGSSRSARLS